MAKYLFQTVELGASDSGIHLLRSGFNYQTITWGEIHTMKIGKGNELQNRWTIFLLGAALFALGVYWSVQTIDILLHKPHAERYAKMLLFLLIPGIGFYFIYNSFRTGIILTINHSGNKTQKFPLTEMIKANQLDGFKQLILQKLGEAKLQCDIALSKPFV
jgi:hypothetical protein